MSLLKKITRKILNLIRQIRTLASTGYADHQTLEKATLFIERHREIISDPLNILIERVPDAGYIDTQNCVILHNGNRVPATGKLSYYGNFSNILILNRGVHEPLEEYCFQEVLAKITCNSPIMIELGAYWAHYSMWLMKKFPLAKCHMIEPDENNIKCGENNFRINNYNGKFIKALVDPTDFYLDKFITENRIDSLTILHSDIQGSELEMLNGGQVFLKKHGANYAFISTHSESLHYSVVQKLKELGYRIEVSSGFDHHTTSYDGFIFASSPKVEAVFEKFHPLGRIEIANSSSRDLRKFISSIESR